VSVLGTDVPRSEYKPLADVIGEVERSAFGNVVLRIGQEVQPRNGWHQTAHVVLTPAEAGELINAIERALGHPADHP
jgi:hypothetical protein